MVTMFSILHISDLHRSHDDPVDNYSLVAALVADRDRYSGETPVVPAPNAIIVSGDLIRGSPIGQDNWQRDIRDQYRVASEFLDQLTRRFLDGDRSKLIIVPGNHDVCWNTSFDSMERVPVAEYPSDVRKALIDPDSNYRWSWKERALYRISKADVYAQRLRAYWEFAEKFYADVPLLRPIDGYRGYQLFELYGRRIVVAAFDSISGNDCFGYSGAIHRGAVARCNLDIRDIPHSYDLCIAVWHHSIQGPPLRDDYMEIGQVYEMAGLRFQLGLHGHQHVAGAATHYVHLSDSPCMAVVSAGSLCAGSRELPRGVNRQYNVIVIEDDLCRARVHVREIVEWEQFSRKSNGAFLQGFVEMCWQPRVDPVGRVIGAGEENTRRAILLAEDALHSGNARRAIELLQAVELPPGSHARSVAIQAALKAENWGFMVTAITEPQSIEEAVFLISALIQSDFLDRAAEVLIKYPGIDAGTRTELEGRIETRRILRAK